jgi:hypothetical protein
MQGALSDERQCNDASSSYIATNGLWASSCWCRASCETHDQLISLFDSYFLSSRCRAPLPISSMNRVIQPEVKSQSYLSVRRNF